MKLKDPKDWKRGRQAHGAAGHRRPRSPASRSTASDLKLPGMLNAAIKDARCSAARSRASTLPQSEKRPGVKQGGAGGRQRRRRGGRHLVARQQGAGRDAHAVGPEGPNAKVSSASHAPKLEGRAGRTRGRRRGQQGRRRQGGAGRRRDASSRRSIRLPAPEPRHHGADERHGALDGRQVRGLDAHAERRGGACRLPPSRGRPAPAKCEVYKLQPGRRLRPARRHCTTGCARPC